MRRANVVGSGPNGLSAAIALAQAGVQVTVHEAAATPGGAVRTQECTLPGYLHDIGSAVYPMASASPFFKTLPLQTMGLQWIEPEIPLAHPLEGGDALALQHSIAATADLFATDSASYRDLIEPLVGSWDSLVHDLLSPVTAWPEDFVALAGFGLTGLRSSVSVAQQHFMTPRVRALFAGMAAHSLVPLNFPGTAAIALVLGITAHRGGWPIAAGGAQSITDTLVRILQSHGGELRTNAKIHHLYQLPPADATLLDITPRQFLELSTGLLTPSQQRPYQCFQYGPGACKVDWALSEPIPWANELCRRAGTVHVGGSMEEIAAAERDSYEGRLNDRPFVLLSQPSLFDASRAPAGRHTAWAYCHVPNGAPNDRSAFIERQVERFAPGFRDCILARSVMTAPQLERWNPNLIGGDVGGGAMTLEQIVVRPTVPPYATPLPGVFLCGACTPPGGGVHGMCGALAAERAARHLGIRLPSLRG